MSIPTCNNVHSPWGLTLAASFMRVSLLPERQQIQGSKLTDIRLSQYLRTLLRELRNIG